MDTHEQGPDRREHERFNYAMPLSYKVCKKETVDKLLEGYTANVSESGILCNIREKVEKDDILWLSFDRQNLSIFESAEKKLLVYQNGIIGKVIRTAPLGNVGFNVGVQFITREEKNSSHIYPTVHFLEKTFRKIE